MKIEPFIIIAAGGIAFLLSRAFWARASWRDDEKRRSYWQHLKFDLRCCGVLIKDAMLHPFRKSFPKVDNDQMKVWVEIEKNGNAAPH